MTGEHQAPSPTLWSNHTWNNSNSNVTGGSQSQAKRRSIGASTTGIAHVKLNGDDDDLIHVTGTTLQLLPPEPSQEGPLTELAKKLTLGFAPPRKMKEVIKPIVKVRKNVSEAAHNQFNEAITLKLSSTIPAVTPKCASVPQWQNSPKQQKEIDTQRSGSCLASLMGDSTHNALSAAKCSVQQQFSAQMLQSIAPADHPPPPIQQLRAWTGKPNAKAHLPLPIAVNNKETSVVDTHSIPSCKSTHQQSNDHLETDKGDQDSHRKVPIHPCASPQDSDIQFVGVSNHDTMEDDEASSRLQWPS